MKKPTLSIVIPVYNAERSVGRIIRKILKQGFRDFELILVDDGSRDGSLGLMRGLARGDRRVRVFHQENGGASSARNLGLAKMRGEFVEFVDADDDFAPKIFEKLVGRMRTDGVDMVCCQMRHNVIKDGKVASSIVTYAAELPERKEGEEFRAYILKLLGVNGRLYHPANKIYRAEIIRKYGLEFQVGLDFGEDFTFNLHYLAHAGSVSFLNEALYYYNLDTAHGTFGKSALVYENRRKNYAEVVKFAGTPGVEPYKSLLGWIRHYWFYAYALAVNGSDLGFGEKLGLLRVAIREGDLAGGGREYWGGRKVWLGRLIRFVGGGAWSLYLFAGVVNGVRGNRRLAGVWRRRVDKVMN